MYNNENLFIERELGPGENILWSAKPICKIKNEGIVMSGFGVFFILVTSFGISNILGSGAPNIMTLFPLIFLCIGIYLLFGPLWVYNTTRDTVYAITNKRALIIIAGKKIKVKAYRLKEDIQALERKENSDGSGNLIFATEISFRNSTDNRSGVNKIKIGFKNINNVYAVQNILQKAINDSAIYTSIVSK